MKVKTQQVLKNLKGEVLTEDTVEVTLGMVISAALLNAPEEKEPEQAYALAKRCSQEKEADLTVEEITFIKERVKKSPLSTLLVGQALTLLNV